MGESWACRGRNVAVSPALIDGPILILRMRRPSEKTCLAVAGAVGTRLPDMPNTAAGQRPRAIWIGPGEWMIVGCTRPAAELEAASDAAATLCIDTGGGLCAMDITGPWARDLLSLGCSLDLHPRKFPAGATAMTVFAQIPALIDQPGEAGHFRLYIDASYRHYMRRWFELAAAGSS